ncbi:MAG: NAD(P)-dependent alcohol dehydrogenase [Actinobacteria bacterium]|nr:NAD(P)-dependent alcohol dehydrogenase [Actinomycetota bacterium]
MTSPTHETQPTIDATMRALVARRYGAPDVLAVETVPTPSPGEGQVLVHVEASSLNALDWHFLTGTPLFMRMMSGVRRPKRIVHGADIAGTVVAVGAGVDQYSVGQRVFGLGDGGGLAAYAVLGVKHMVPIPDGVSFQDAAATPLAGITALQALRTHGTVQPGDHVLVNGAAGGVGTFAVQIAKALGAQVTAVCSTGKVDMVRRLGADAVLDYTKDDFVVGGARFDVMLDNAGNRTPAECISVLRPGARYVVVTGPKKNRWLGPVPHILWTGIKFRRADASFHQFTAATNVEDLALLAEMLANRSVVPEIDRVIGLDGVAAGLTEIGAGHTRSKIVVTPG